MEEYYLFLFGNTPQLASKELESFFINWKIEASVEHFSLYALVKASALDYSAVLNQLGGTVKIALVLGDDYNLNKLQESIFRELNNSKQKVVFGISAPDKSISQQSLHVLKSELKRKLALTKKGVRFI